MKMLTLKTSEWNPRRWIWKYRNFLFWTTEITEITRKAIENKNVKYTDVPEILKYDQTKDKLKKEKPYSKK